MVYSGMKILSALQPLAEIMKAALSDAEVMLKTGMNLQPEALEGRLAVLLSTWNPLINNKPLVDDEARAHAAKFFARIVVAYARA